MFHSEDFTIINHLPHILTDKSTAINGFKHQMHEYIYTHWCPYVHDLKKILNIFFINNDLYFKDWYYNKWKTITFTHFKDFLLLQEIVIFAIFDSRSCIACFPKHFSNMQDSKAIHVHLLTYVAGFLILLCP